MWWADTTTGPPYALKIRNAGNSAWELGMGPVLTTEMTASDFKATGITGAASPLLLVGTNASGHPTAGAHVAGEIAGDISAGLWFCVASGTPGTWLPVGSSTGGTTLLAVVAGTDGATAAVNNTFAAFSTAWSGSVTISATSDIIIEVEASWSVNDDAVIEWGIFRGGTQIYSSGVSYEANANLFCQSKSLRYVDRGVGAGTITYEVRPGAVNSHTVTLHNALVTTPAGTLTGTRGTSQMSISSAANV